MLRCGLLGETLGHSYSPMIHHELGEYDYRLFEVSKADLDAFLRSNRWDGLNVTIPYKKAVVPYCAELSEAAERLQSVNTLVRRPDGTLYGDNTDLFGFLYMVRSSGIDPAGKKALVLGSGGASVTVKAALEQLGADVTVISRSGPDDYDHLDRHADAQIIANTTPVGMYPHNGAAAVDLRRFPRCEGVLDIVYNPARTALLLQAEELGIPHAGGLSMLVAQAKRSSEQFTGTVIGDEALERVERTVNHRLRNIILIGMPGSGKSTCGVVAAKLLLKNFFDTDLLIQNREGRRLQQIIDEKGLDYFARAEEEAVLSLDIAGTVIATGGSVVYSPAAMEHLRRMGKVIYLHLEYETMCRRIQNLDSRGVVLQAGYTLQDMYKERLPLYRRYADAVIKCDNNTVEQTAQQIARCAR